MKHIYSQITLPGIWKIHRTKLPKAQQLQRSFGLLNECLPFGLVPDAVLPICYFHSCYMSLFTSSSHLFFGLPSDLVIAGDHSHSFFTMLLSGIWCTLSEPSWSLCFDIVYDVCITSQSVSLLNKPTTDIHSPKTPCQWVNDKHLLLLQPIKLGLFWLAA